MTLRCKIFFLFISFLLFPVVPLYKATAIPNYLLLLFYNYLPGFSGLGFFSAIVSGNLRSWITGTFLRGRNVPVAQEGFRVSFLRDR